MSSLDLSERLAAANAASTAKLQPPGAHNAGLLDQVRACRATYPPLYADSVDWMRDADRLLGEIEAALTVNQE